MATTYPNRVSRVNLHRELRITQQAALRLFHHVGTAERAIGRQRQRERDLLARRGGQPPRIAKHLHELRAGRRDAVEWRPTPIPAFATIRYAVRPGPNSAPRGSTEGPKCSCPHSPQWRSSCEIPRPSDPGPVRRVCRHDPARNCLAQGSPGIKEPGAPITSRPRGSHLLTRGP